MRTLTAFVVLASGLAAQERFAASEQLDALIEEAIAQDQIPGAVLLVGQPGRLLHRKAYGWRALEPTREAMTLDTIFDAA
ncbi:MAG: serine hydrolase, partial [Bryobacteraceae bacterium]